MLHRTGGTRESLRPVAFLAIPCLRALGPLPRRSRRDRRAVRRRDRHGVPRRRRTAGHVAAFIRPSVNPNFHTIGIELEGGPSRAIMARGARLPLPRASSNDDRTGRWRIPLDADHVCSALRDSPVERMSRRHLSDQRHHRRPPARGATEPIVGTRSSAPGTARICGSGRPARCARSRASSPPSRKCTVTEITDAGERHERKLPSGTATARATISGPARRMCRARADYPILATLPKAAPPESRSDGARRRRRPQRRRLSPARGRPSIGRACR